MVVFIFVLFLLNGFNLSFIFKFGFVPVFLITAALKIYWMSAMAGCILEVICGKEYVFRFRSLPRNAKELWPAFLTVFAVICLLDFILYASFGVQWPAWRPLFFNVATAVAAFGLAAWAIHQKYIKALGLAHRKIDLTPGFLAVMILACLLEWALTTAAHSIHTGAFYGRNVLTFAAVYIHVFEFVFCSMYLAGHYPEIKQKFESKPEIFLVYPMAAAVIHSIGFRIFMPWNPPFFTVLKALTPQSYKFHEFNQVIWHERYYKSNVLVCISTFTTNCYEAYKIAKEYKQRGAKVVMGGPHVTFLSREALSFCDSVIVGQAEGVWKQVIQDYENGCLQPQYSGPASQEDYHQVHEKLLDSPPEVVRDFLETSRGCKFRCHFCAVPALSNGQLRLQSINDIVDLAKKVKGHYYIKFLDNNIYSDPGYAKELFLALKPLKIKWRAMCTIDIAKNEETLRLAKESGCTGLFFGYEVSGESFEKNQGGKFAMAQKYKEYTKIIKKAGIKVAGSFVYGFDSDNLKSFFKLWKFSFSMMPFVSHVAMLTPIPGTVVFHDMLAQNRIINLNWRSHDYSKLVVRHPGLKPSLMVFLFPVMRIIFLLTSNASGFVVLFIAFSIPLYGKFFSFLR